MFMAFAGVVSEAHMNQANKRKLAEMETMTLWVVMDTERDLALNVKATDSICTVRTKMQEVIAAGPPRIMILPCPALPLPNFIPAPKIAVIALVSRNAIVVRISLKSLWWFSRMVAVFLITI